MLIPVISSSPNQDTLFHTVLMFSNLPRNIPFYYSKPFQTQGDTLSSSLFIFSVTSYKGNKICNLGPRLTI
mgnify:CR=1 FL=1